MSVWLLAIAGLGAVNLLLGASALYLASRAPRTAPPVIVTAPPGTVDVAVASLEAHVNQLDRSLRDLRSTLKQSQKEIKVVTVEQAVDKRRERLATRDLKKSGAPESSAPRAAHRERVAAPQPVQLRAADIAALDSMVDQDLSGDGVIAFLRGITNAPLQQAYLESLVQKGDQWLNAAYPLLDDQDADGLAYIDNAQYFYNIIAEVTPDTGLRAYIEAKRNEQRLALQGYDARIAQQEQARREAATTAELERKFTPRETAGEAEARLLRERRYNIKQYPDAGTVKSYQTDWDPDPRVREERGLVK